MLGLPLDISEDFVAKIDTINKEQIRDVVKKYLVDERLTVGVLIPKNITN